MVQELLPVTDKHSRDYLLPGAPESRDPRRLSSGELALARFIRKMLTPAAVREIRAELAAGESATHIAWRRKLAVSTIRDIKTGRTWAGVR